MTQPASPKAALQPLQSQTGHSAATPPKAIQHRRKTDLVHEYLREQIINGTYAPGRRMILAELSSEMGLSQMPVREALQRLEQEGLLESEPHRGMRVVVPSPSAAKELFEIRAELEGLAAYKAAASGDPGLVADLTALNARFASARDARDYPAMGAANWSFHRRILQAADSVQLGRVLEDVWTGSARYRLGYQLIPGRANQTVTEHATIIGAIAAGDPGAARAAARWHIELAGAELDRIVRAEAAGAPVEEISGAAPAVPGAQIPARAASGSAGGGYPGEAAPGVRKEKS